MKKFLNKVVAFLKSIFENFDTFVHDHVTPSIELTQKLINILESPVANLITALIPGDADDKLKDLVLIYLHKAIDALHISADIVNEPNWTIKLYKTLEYAKSLSPELRQGFFRDLTRNIIKQSVIGSGGVLPGRSRNLNLTIEGKLNEVASDVLDNLPNETIVNGELQTPVVTPVAVAEPVTPVVTPVAVAEPVAPVVTPVAVAEPVEPVVTPVVVAE